MVHEKITLPDILKLRNYEMMASCGDCHSNKTKTTFFCEESWHHSWHQFSNYSKSGFTSTLHSINSTTGCENVVFFVHNSWHLFVLRNHSKRANEGPAQPPGVCACHRVRVLLPFRWWVERKAGFEYIAHYAYGPCLKSVGVVCDVFKDIWSVGVVRDIFTISLSFYPTKRV